VCPLSLAALALSAERVTALFRVEFRPFSRGVDGDPPSASLSSQSVCSVGHVLRVHGHRPLRASALGPRCRPGRYGPRCRRPALGSRERPFRAQPALEGLPPNSLNPDQGGLGSDVPTSCNALDTAAALGNPRCRPLRSSLLVLERRPSTAASSSPTSSSMLSLSRNVLLADLCRESRRPSSADASTSFSNGSAGRGT